MVSFGDSKNKPVKPLHRLLDVKPLKLALYAKCTIHDVTAWCSLYSVIFLSICYYFPSAVCWGRQALWLVLVVRLAFFERPANVLDYEALGSVKSIAKSSNEEIPFNSFVSIQSIPLPGV